MQKKKWVRLSLGAALVGGAFAASTAAGCSGDDTSGTSGDSGTKSDSSIPSGDSSGSSGSSSGGTGSSGSSSGGTGSSGSSSGGSTMPNAKVYIVHAAADPLTRPLRFCFGLNPSGDAGGSTVAGGIDPFPDSVTVPGAPYAGLYPGFGGSTASSPTLAAFDLSTLTIALYALDATQINNDTADGGPDGGKEVPCEGLIGTDALGKAGTGGGTLTMGTQYWYLGTIQKGTLAHGTSWVAAVTGCFPGEQAAYSTPFCPKTPAYSASTGNLVLTPFQLDTTTAIGDGGIGAQFANASPAWDGLNTNLAGGASTGAGFWVETTSDGGGTSGGGEAGTGEAGASFDAGADAGASDGGAAVDSGGGGGPTTTVSFTPITGTGVYGTISPAKAVTVPVPLNSETAGFFSSFIAADGGSIQFQPGCTPGVNCASPLLLPLPTIDDITNGKVTGEFVNGSGYAFILVGDPQQPTYVNPLDGGAATSTTGVFNGASIHFLAFPSAN